VKERIRNLLAGRQKRHVKDPRRIPSAVLVPLRERQGRHYLLFIRRTLTVKTHKGQISFPGGTWEETDGSRLNTALRECDEEIGLNPEDAEVLGELDDEITATSNYIVTPYVALIPGEYAFTLNADEVAELIEVPLEKLLEENRRIPLVKDAEQELLEAYTYHHDGEVIWGATARILRHFLNMLEPPRT
jgi:8-oxo-dGTP pyrophosphatase MutT (NUDIX family)